jgi:hypothetical protein
MSSLYRPTESLSGDLEFFWAYTLIDITDTGYSNPKGSTKEYRQAQNLNTLIQILSLRTQLVISSVSKLNEDISDHQFGTDYTGLNDIWLLKFASERPDAWAKKEDSLYFANEDCNNVPVNINLDETATIDPMFLTNDPVRKNLYFTMSKFL